MHSRQFAADAAWTWFNDERAIFLRGGALLIGYVRRDGRIAVTHFSDGCSRETVLSSRDVVQKDDHNNPSLTLLPDGRVLAVYSLHGKTEHYYWRISVNDDPKSDEDWGAEQARHVQARNTYSNVYALADERDRLFNFHRCVNRNPALSLSDDQGATWDGPRLFIATGDGRLRPYLRACSNGRNRIDIIYTDEHPLHFNNSVYHLFYEEGVFRESRGGEIKGIDALPLAHDKGERGTVVYQYSDEQWRSGDGPDDWIPGGRAWVWDLAYGADGKPVCVFQVRRGDVAGEGWRHDRIYYYHARWTRDGWNKTFIAQGGRPLYEGERDYGGGIALDPGNPDVVYLSSNARHPFSLASIDDVPLSVDEKYRLYRLDLAAPEGYGEDIAGGLEGDSLRPKVVRSRQGRAVLWLQGEYRSYRDFDTRIYGTMERAGQEGVARWLIHALGRLWRTGAP